MNRNQSDYSDEEESAEDMNYSRQNSKKSKKRHKEEESSDEDEWVERVANSDQDDSMRQSSVKRSASKAHPDKKKHRKKSKKRRQEKESSSDEEEWVESRGACRDMSPQGKKKHAKKSKKHHKEKKEKKTKRDKEKEEKGERHVVGDGDNSSSSVKREDWMTGGLGFKLPTYSKERKEPTKPNEKMQQQVMETYDPTTSKLELNRNWRNNGTGLPAFKKPQADDDDSCGHRIYSDDKPTTAARYAPSVRNWQKPNLVSSPQSSMERNSNSSAASVSNPASNDSTRTPADTTAPSANSTKASTSISDDKLNQLATQQLRAKFASNLLMSKKLNHELTVAREERSKQPESAVTPPKRNQSVRPTGKTLQHEEERERQQHVLLTCTDSSGNMRPLIQSSRNSDDFDRHVDDKRHKKDMKKKAKKETHDKDGQRLRYFADDDNYTLKEMFEREKLSDTGGMDAEYAKIISKHKNPNDDLEDIFADEIRNDTDQQRSHQRELMRAIGEEKKKSKMLDSCDLCYDSAKMDREMVVCSGNKVYLSIPAHTSLQRNQCMLISKDHVSSCTQMDEDVWEELNDFRQALVQMLGKDVIFYEIANNLHKHKHVTVHCIPIPSSYGERVPFYFKKAFEESEKEWSVNKQLVYLGKKTLRASIPRGLPYVWVNFGMDSGLAHVIEDRDRFPPHFVKEIIAGMLSLEPRTWRKPMKEKYPLDKVKNFATKWKPFDFTPSLYKIDGGIDDGTEENSTKP